MKVTNGFTSMNYTQRMCQKLYPKGAIKITLHALYLTHIVSTLLQIEKLNFSKIKAKIITK